MSLIEGLMREIDEKPQLAALLAEKLGVFIQARMLEEQKRLREDFNRMLERIARIEEEQRSMKESIEEMRREQRKMKEAFDSFRESMIYGLGQLGKFAGVTFEGFVRMLLTKELQELGVIKRDKELTKAVIRGEEIDLFCEDPLIVGEVTAHAESAEEVNKLMRKSLVVEEEYKRISKKILVILTAPREVADEIRRICAESGIEVVIGKSVD